MKELNNLIIKLSKDVTYKNFLDIVIYMQQNKFNVNNKLIDDIINEKDEKKQVLIYNIKSDNSIDFSSSGFAAQLFSIFNNIKYFCIKENKYSECAICGKKTLEILNDLKPFV